MNDSTCGERWCLPERVAEVRESPELAFIMADWPVVAAVAWQGLQAQGRGTVMMDGERCLGYIAGAPCECHRHLAEAYDPEREVVVALHEGGRVRSINVVAGWPPPPDAYQITPVERLQLTEH